MDRAKCDWCKTELPLVEHNPEDEHAEQYACVIAVGYAERLVDDGCWDSWEPDHTEANVLCEECAKAGQLAIAKAREERGSHAKRN